MALFVIISTLSFSIEKHYCGDKLVAVGIFTEARKCGSDEPAAPRKDRDQDRLFIQASCCKDTVDLFEGQDELSIQKAQVFKVNQKVFFLSFAAVFGGSYLQQSTRHNRLESYTPPLFSKDIQLLHEVFLI